jgi:hypothetical protein
MSKIPSFSSKIASQLEILAEKIPLEPKQVASETKLTYPDTLLAIHEITQPLFDKIATLAEKAGFGKIEAFQAWPKALCENFVFAVIEASGNITHVILAKNKKHGFLQNGGGKTGATETSEQAVLREAQEEFGFNGRMEQTWAKKAKKRLAK